MAAISHAMARDGSSGGVIRLITIDKDGVSREFIPGKRLQVIPSEVFHDQVCSMLISVYLTVLTGDKLPYGP